MSMTEKEYRNLPSDEYYSASFLKMFDKEGAESLINEIKYEGKELLKGSIIDDLAFNKDNFDNIYYTSDSIREPTVTELKLINVLSELVTVYELGTESYITKGLNAIKSLSLWKNITKEPILRSKLEHSEFKKLLKDHILKEDKIVISGNDYMNSLNTVQHLKTNKYTEKYFNQKDIKKKQVLFQTPILYDVNGDKFKSLLDIILIDHENKQIRAVDLKTGFDNNRSFKYSILKYRYDIQGALYTKALETYIIINDLKEYSIQNPIFIYTQVSKPDRPICFEFNDDIIKSAFKGFETDKGYNYKGILELVEEIKWHRSNNIYHYSKEEYENGLIVLKLKDFGIKRYNRDLVDGIFNNYMSNDGLSFYNLNSSIDSSQEILQRQLQTLSRNMHSRGTRGYIRRGNRETENVNFEQPTAVNPFDDFEADNNTSL